MGPQERPGVMAAMRPLPTPLRWLIRIALAALLAALGWFYAYFRLFSSFADADDEGWQMMTVHHFLQGYAPYDDIFTSYGPFYYAVELVVHRGLGVPITNDATRVITLVLWTAIAGVMGFTALRMTGRASFAALVYVLTASYLTATRWEPGHPQELCALVVALSVAIPTWGEPFRLGWVATGAGALAASLTLMKINLGAFATLAWLLALVLLSNGSRLARLARVIGAGAAIVFPFLLLKDRLATSWGMGYAVIISVAVGAVLVSTRSRAEASWWPALGAFIVSSLVTAAALCLFVFARGTTPYGLFNALVLQPRRMVSTFVFPTTIHPAAPWGAATSLALALLHAARKRVNRRAAQPFSNDFFVLLKGVYGAAILILAQRQAAIPLLNFGIPFLWLVLVPDPTSSGEDRQAPARLILCLVAALQALEVYPVPGSQYYIGTFPLILVGSVCLGDALAWLEQRFAGRPAAARLACAAPLLALVAAMILCARLGYGSFLAYRAATPLAVPGANGLHLDESRVATYQWLVSNLRRYADTFLCVTGFNSLYLWTGKESPSHVGLGNLIEFFSAEQQQFLVESLSRYPNACVIDHEPYFQPLILPNVDRPHILRDAIDREFLSCGRVQGFTFLIRRGQPLPRLVDCARWSRGNGPVKSVTLDLSPAPGQLADRVYLFDPARDLILADSRPTGSAPTLHIFGSRSADQSPALNLSTPRPLTLQFDEPIDPRLLEWLLVRLLDREGNVIRSVPFLVEDSPREDQRP